MSTMQKVRTGRVAETCRSSGPRSRMRERVDALTCRWYLGPFVRLLFHATISFRASGWISIPAVICAINLRDLVDSRSRCKLFLSVCVHLSVGVYAGETAWSSSQLARG